MLRSLLFCAALLMPLTACNWSAEPKVIEKPYPISVYVPESLRECPNLPKVADYVPPDSEGQVYQSEVAQYVTALHRAARTCKTNLNGVDDILDKHEASSPR